MVSLKTFGLGQSLTSLTSRMSSCVFSQRHVWPRFWLLKYNHWPQHWAHTVPPGHLRLTPWPQVTGALKMKQSDKTSCPFPVPWDSGCDLFDLCRGCDSDDVMVTLTCVTMRIQTSIYCYQSMRWDVHDGGLQKGGGLCLVLVWSSWCCHRKEI
jgi:hypothetical protein